MMNRRASLLTGLLAWGGLAGASGTLRFAVGQSWGPPFLLRSGTRIEGGLLPELMTAVAAELDRQPEFQLLPPMRVERAMEDGSVDLQCLLNPSWWPAVRDPARWSVALFRLRDVLVSTPGGPRTAQAVARRTWTVSTVRGYVYPGLDAAFAQGRLKRDDALSQQAVLDKLSRGRTALGVVNDYVLQAWLRDNPGRELHIVQVVDEVDAHCLFSVKAQVPLPQMQQAVRRLVSSGRLKLLLQRYSGSGEEAPG